ncbi:NADH-quinone oxidoreductase subunit NuoE [Candidatus Pantoea edessiphila]|uniref:NADH-quinone oxidoreductase subunit E n=1 Tax=Candidatus Pantoea edessiphila TaxID=2044610 RepID=A0A2P5SYH9_9GAMM|nr:NADH-quinone oxidoreductase subunit NuoE [Candidatus Pantoea edessiphila]MBK4775474.1 NADH-quinone oxidoreductase subunit NuoE [Pantoea sp. Edef]PPI87397.1 NADH-quinone oxidoreductase subunit NuoE [Candidatus Pantoea edessiphila]
MYKKIIPVKTIHQDELFVLSNEEYLSIEEEKKYYEHSRSVCIEALKIVQKKRGWVCDNAIKAIAEILNLSYSEVEGVATFYSQIFRKPVGRNIIRYCDSVVCYINGYKDIQLKLEQKLNIKPGKTTLDNRFTLLPVCCLGNCDKGPTIMINEETYIRLKIEDIDFMLEQYQ